MKGIVKKLCDIDGIAIPAEMLEVHVDDKQVEQAIRRLSLRYAKECPAEAAQKGDLVRCHAEAGDGRLVLLYPGMALPGAEEAEEAALGKAAGDAIETTLCGKPVSLTVENILRRAPVEVTDALIASIGIEGVTTVAEYRVYLRNQMLADLRMERSKEITRYLMDEMIAGCEYEYDEAEMEQYIRSAEEEMAMQPDLDELGYSPEELRQAIADQAKQLWMAEAFCKAHGIAIDEADVTMQADQMQEMMSLMGEPVPDREALLEQARQDAYLTGLFTYIDNIIEQKMGGSYGNC